MSDPAPPSGPSRNPVVLAAGLEPAGQARDRAAGPVADRGGAGWAPGRRPGGEAAEFDRIAQVAAAQGEVSTLVKRLQEERLRTTEFIVAGRTGDTAALQASFAEVDEEQAAIRPIVAGVYDDDAAVVGAHRQAEQALALLPQLRELVLRSNSPAGTAVARYSELIDQVLPLDSALLRGVNSSEVNGLANALAGAVVGPQRGDPAAGPDRRGHRGPGAERRRAGRAAGQRGPAGHRPEQLPHRAGHRAARAVRRADRRTGEQRPRPAGPGADRRRPGAGAARRHRGRARPRCTATSWPRWTPPSPGSGTSWPRPPRRPGPAR